MLHSIHGQWDLSAQDLISTLCVCGLKVLYFTRMLAHVARYAPIVLAGGAYISRFGGKVSGRFKKYILVTVVYCAVLYNKIVLVRSFNLLWDISK